MIIHIGQIGVSLDTINPIDISIKSANTVIGQIFAPTWDMVKAIKSKDPNYDWFDYENDYQELIGNRLMDDANYNVFADTFVENFECTLMCYCSEGVNCHRTLVRAILAEFCAYSNIDFKYGSFIK